MFTIDIRHNISLLRAFLIDYNNLSGIIITSSDDFNNEYVAEENNRLLKIIGFGGSNGLILVTNRSVLFYTDDRYIAEANRLFADYKDIITITNDDRVFKSELQSLDYTGFISSIMTLGVINSLSIYTKMIPIANHAIDKLFNIKTKYQKNSYFLQKIEESGESVSVKIDNTLKLYDFTKIDAIFIAKNSSVCWLLNIREVKQYTGIHDVHLLLFGDGKYQLIYSVDEINAIKSLRIAFDPKDISYSFYQQLSKENTTIEQSNLILYLQSVKNEVEIKSFKRAHELDGIVVRKFLNWVRKAIRNDLVITERDCQKELLRLRKRNNDFISESFESIIGFGSNSAMIHYKPSNNKEDTVIENNNILLIDSGGNYSNNATTDITRTIAIGSVSSEIKKSYTLVLKAHIALAMQRFPVNTKTDNLDIIARHILWNHYMDYGHGTGHGVGSFLSVHEYPSISKNSSGCLVAGNIVSIEPGYYKKNEYGIRIENLYLVQDSKSEKNWLEFVTLTRAPFDKNLIIDSLLTKEEKQWIRNNS